MIHLVYDTPPHTCGLELDVDGVLTKDELKRRAAEYSLQHFGFTYDFYLLHNGKLYNESSFSGGDVHVVPRMCGGKGGFGSMLRAIGAQIEKTTNREACRDLSGRRLRDINEEKRLKKWIAEQAEREQEAAKKKRKKLEKLTEIVKHDFVNEDYTKARLEMPEKIHESVEEGLKAATEAEASTAATVPKEKAKKPVKKAVKGNLWVDDLDGLDDSDLSSESEEETPKKKLKVS